MKTKIKLAGTVLAVGAAAVFALAPAVTNACGGKSGSSSNGCKSKNSCGGKSTTTTTTTTKPAKPQDNQADGKSN